VARYVDSVVAICGSAKEAGDAWVRVDEHTRSLVISNFEHYLIHSGFFFAVMYTAKDVPNDGFMDLVIKASEEREVHALRARWWSVGDALLEAYGGVKIGDDEIGVIQPVNMLFGAAREMSARFWGDPDISDPGTLAFTQYLPGGTHPRRCGGLHEIAYEWVLPRGGDVLIRTHNISGAAGHMAFQINVFEDGENIKDRW